MPLERSDTQPQPVIKGKAKGYKLDSRNWQKRKHHSLFASGIEAAYFVEDTAESPARRGCPFEALLRKIRGGIIVKSQVFETVKVKWSPYRGSDRL